MIERLKALMVVDCHNILRWWSVRWAALGAVLLPLMQMVPVFEPEVQALLPLWLRVPITCLWCVIFIVLRVTAQKKLDG